MLGDHVEELQLARRGREFFPTSFARLQDEVEALAALGRIEEVNQRLDESLTFSEGSPGTLMHTAALELRAHGHSSEARQLLDRALGWYENRPPNEKGSEEHRYNVARTLHAAERWEEAQLLFRELNAEDAENISYLGYVGVLAARLGDRAEALRISDHLADRDDPYLGGSNTYWRGGIAAVLGDRERAVNLLREAHSEGTAFGITWHRSVVLEPLRGYEPFENFLRPKG
jgi:tetratricopeptide (TPR) repeat protein